MAKIDETHIVDISEGTLTEKSGETVYCEVCVLKSLVGSLAAFSGRVFVGLVLIYADHFSLSNLDGCKTRIVKSKYSKGIT